MKQANMTGINTIKYVLVFFLLSGGGHCMLSAQTSEKKPPMEIIKRGKRPLGWHELEKIVKSSGASEKNISRTEIPSNIIESDCTCPVCGHKFKLQKLKHWDAKNGMDTDFCRHSVSISQYLLSLTMCCKCGYTEKTGSFPAEVDGNTKRFVRKNLTADTRTFIKKEVNLKLDMEFIELSQKTIPPLIKFQNAFDISQFKQKEPAHMARLCAEAAWAMRIEFCKAPFCNEINASLTRVGRLLDKQNYTPHDPYAAIDLLNAFLEKAKLNKSDRFLVYHLISANYDRIGDKAASTAYLKKCFETAGEVPFLQRLASQKKQIFAKESAFRIKAIENYTSALRKNAYTPSEIPPVLYLVAEMLRREAAFLKSYFWLKAVSKILAGKTSPLVRLCQTQLSRVSDVLEEKDMEKKPPQLLRKIVFEHGK